MSIVFKITEKDVIFEDNHLLIIHKPAGILSQGDKTNDKSILDYGKSFLKVKYNKPGNVFLGLPHRLDRPVSGAIILCKTSKALTRMNQMIAKGNLKKIYHALTIKAPIKKSDTIVSYLRKNQHKNKVDSFEYPEKNTKKAILNYRVLRNSNNVSLIEVELLTGRPHQIRVQLNSIGAPILGDMKYYNQKPLPDKSIALHARYVEFTHPTTKETIQLSCPYPNNAWWLSL